MKKQSYTIMMLTTILLLSSLLLLKNKLTISIEIPLMNIMSTQISISLILDWVSMLFLTTVLGISSAILMFSVYYITKSEHKQFSLLLLSFVLSMIILIMSDNIILIILGWDLLGLTSYILVIYYQNFQSSGSGSITILMNRVGDVMILITISILMIHSNWKMFMNNNFSLLIMMLLITAALSKSAQFPFSAWLPAAMAAPTPISALVHSSTLVTAGVYLLLRIMNNPHPISMTILMIISSATTMYASMAANWENDMKKIIALSTLSQIAMMMFAISINSINLAFFHLITHALFKSLMFMCAGVIIHNSSYQNMHMMNMNSLNSPLITSSLGVTSLSLTAIPFMSGFFSKDAILENLLSNKLNMIMSLMMITSIGMTASYSMRMLNLSTKMLALYKPNTNFHNLNSSNSPITLMTPFSISTGATLYWLINTEQMFMMPTIYKFSIPFLLIMGLLTPNLMKFKTKTFINTGQSALSLWFNHSLSSTSLTKSSNQMKIFLLNDLSWQETYGPSGLTLVMMKSLNMNPMTKIPMMLIIMTLLIPMIM